ncbi:putative trehalose-phosphate phosphatase F-like [Capsicum annuum]|nr:putative trehalose-phosphate phosphatase F-like [Capsicum annuum]
MHHLMSALLTTKKLFSSASVKKRKKEQDCYLNNGSAVLEEILALCNGNCRIPIRYFTATEIERAIKHPEKKIELDEGYMVTGSLDNHLFLIRFSLYSYGVHRDIAITAQMSHLKNVLRLIGCCLEFEEPVMVYEYIEGISLGDLLFEEGNHDDQTRNSLLSWGSRLRIANEVASALVFLHTEFTTPIIHRDIKPHKVIIDQNSSIAKIVDFSFSISLPSGELEVQDRVCGTIEYLDPEYGYCGIITQKTDVYSFGVLLFELLTGKELRDIMESNVEEGNVMDRVDSAISEETINFENFLPNLIDRYIKEGNIMDIADNAILEEHGIEIQQQLQDYLNLVKKCTTYNRKNRPYMIQVAKELCRIHKCFHAFTLGQI